MQVLARGGWLPLTGLTLALIGAGAVATAQDPVVSSPQTAGVIKALLAGFGTSLSLILAIGAQNAFVLRQGLRRSHVFWVCLFCAVSDAILIAAGVLGAGHLMAAVPWLAPAMRWGGAAFLIWYGARSLRSAWQGGSAMQTGGAVMPGLAATMGTIALLTWANPHVYLDTLVLIGAISARWAETGAFATGAITASFVFFFSLGYGARLLAPVFARPNAWRVLDAGVGLVMWLIAATLIAGN